MRPIQEGEMIVWAWEYLHFGGGIRFFDLTECMIIWAAE